jgi:YHS domain-containing protein
MGWFTGIWAQALAESRSRSGFLVAAQTAFLALACLITGTYGAGNHAVASPNLLAPDKNLHVISDPRNGLAIFGYDPVAFHDEQKALPGSANHEVSLDGRIWRFHRAANKAAFEADPSIYMPMFGGHDGIGIADDVLIKGDPEIFLIAGGRVVFFRNPENREKFAADPDLRRKAIAAWPKVVRQQALH